MNPEETAISKPTRSFGLSLAVCSVLNALLVVAKEKSKSVSDGMQRMTGHHWITHVAIVLIFFVAFGWLFAVTNSGAKMGINRLTNIVMAAVAGGVVMILSFYLMAG
jgi:hypothetical protein